MNINSKQQAILIIGALITIAMLVFPPFMHEVKMSTGSVWSFDGFGFIITTEAKMVNIPQLLTQWIGVVLTTFMFKMALADKKESL